MALAGYATVVRIRTSSGLGTSADNLGNATQVSLDRVRDELENTHFGDADKDFIAGLKGADVSISFDQESANDTAMGRIETAYGDGTSVWVACLWNGTAGHNVECKVLGINIEAGVGDKVTGSATLKATGAVATV